MTTDIEAKKLTTEERKDIPKGLFAVPDTEQLPIHDVSHTKMAWNMLNKTQGLSPEQKSSAKNRILRRAHKLGVDTGKWNVNAEEMEAACNLSGAEDCDVEAFAPVKQNIDPDYKANSESEKADELHASFQGMAMDIPVVKDHPNRIPFSGILTRIDEPSDNPLGGSNGKRVIIPKEVAQTALPSLLGMSIDFQDDLSGHDPQKKIGLITAADIKGNEICIEGFFYGADYPIEVKRIQAEKSRLGFSYEAQVQIQSMNDDPLVIKNCVFTGAAVLYKDKAAYTSTSLTAQADEENKMSTEILDALKALQADFDTVKKELKEVKASAGTSVQANSVYAMVEPHAHALHAAADAMEKAGIGLHAANGHVAHIRGVANHMRAEAAMGKMPHVYQTSDFYRAGADNAGKSEISPEVQKLTDMVANLETKLADAEKQRFSAAATAERKTLSPIITTLLANHGKDSNGAESGKVALSIVDKALKEKGMSVTNRLATKLLMNANGMIDGGN